MDADHLVAVLLGAALVVCIGIIDDLFGMRARAKLSAQVAIGVVVALLGLAIQYLDGPWGRVSLGPWTIPATVIWFVLVMNAINLIDGLDGLASGVVLIAMGAMYLVALRTGMPLPLAAVLGAVAGAVLGFLPFNLFPATIIMGDTGSILLGFLVAAAGITVTQSGSPAAPPWVPIIVLAVPLLDTAWAVSRRAIAGSPIFAPDKKHVHHRLLAAGPLAAERHARAVGDLSGNRRHRGTARSLIASRTPGTFRPRGARTRRKVVPVGLVPLRGIRGRP